MLRILVEHLYCFQLKVLAKYSLLIHSKFIIVNAKLGFPEMDTIVRDLEAMMEQVVAWVAVAMQAEVVTCAKRRRCTSRSDLADAAESTNILPSCSYQYFN